MVAKNGINYGVEFLWGFLHGLVSLLCGLDGDRAICYEINLSSVLDCAMTTQQYQTAVACLQENLRTLQGPAGVLPQNQALWNISNAMLVMLDALRAIQPR